MTHPAKHASRAIGLTTLALSAGCFTMESPEPRVPVDVASLGPQVGELVPDFRLPDQHGEMRTLESVAGPSGTMLLFHRSADW